MLLQLPEELDGAAPEGPVSDSEVDARFIGEGHDDEDVEFAIAIEVARLHVIGVD